MASNVEIYNQDIIEWCKSYDGPQFHAVLCDPPYHLTDISRTFQANGESIDAGQQRSNQRRKSGGFMGKDWDGGDIAFRPETWAAIGEHLLPGAFIMAFGGSRTFHRLACAIEDAGYIIHPAICWLYGSGFPKATNISRQIDDQWAKENYGGWCDCEEDQPESE